MVHVHPDRFDISSLIQPVTYQGYHFSILRLDLMPAWASGNKYFKLKHYIETARESHVRTLVSKGGMFSNHLDAFAQACRFFKLDAVCLIRSHQPDLDNPTIRRLIKAGAAIQFLPPEQYAAYDEVKSTIDFPGSLFIPEGGLSVTGLHGAMELGTMVRHLAFDRVLIMGGTMCTAMGLVATAHNNVAVTIIPAWKGCTDEYVVNLMHAYSITPTCRWEIWPDYHFGGFGKWDMMLYDFMIDFTSSTGIPLDPVYTGKMVYAFIDTLKSSPQIDASKFLLIHTGGLQGIEGFAYRHPAVWNSYLKLTSTLN